ncbi:unnamed protein product, partial [Prorocentrum cordatum]
MLSHQLAPSAEPEADPFRSWTFGLPFKLARQSCKKAKRAGGGAPSGSEFGSAEAEVPKLAQSRKVPGLLGSRRAEVQWIQKAIEKDIQDLDWQQVKFFDGEARSGGCAARLRRLERSPKRGGGAAHGFTREAEVEVTPEEVDHFILEEEVLMGPTQILEAKGKFWGQCWGPLQFGASCPVSELALEKGWKEHEVARGFKTFPGHSATDIDQWRARDFNGLPEAGLAQPAAHLIGITRQQVLPVQCLGILFSRLTPVAWVDGLRARMVASKKASVEQCPQAIQPVKDGLKESGCRPSPKSALLSNDNERRHVEVRRARLRLGCYASRKDIRRPLKGQMPIHRHNGDPKAMELHQQNLVYTDVQQDQYKASASQAKLPPEALGPTTSMRAMLLYMWLEVVNAEPQLREGISIAWPHILMGRSDTPDLRLRSQVPLVHARGAGEVFSLGNEKADELADESAARAAVPPDLAYKDLARARGLPFFAGRGWRRPAECSRDRPPGGRLCASPEPRRATSFNEDHFPRLARGPLWATVDVPLAGFLEAHFHDFLADLELGGDDNFCAGESVLPWFAELHAANANAGSHYQEFGPRDDDWQTVYLLRGGAWSAAACRAAPRACALLRARPEVAGCPLGGAGFLRLAPGGRVKPHFGAGPRLAAHLGLVVPEAGEIRLTVGGEQVAWQAGRALVFDDTFAHTCATTASSRATSSTCGFPTPATRGRLGRPGRSTAPSRA